MMLSYIDSVAELYANCVGVVTVPPWQVEAEQRMRIGWTFDKNICFAMPCVTPPPPPPPPPPPVPVLPAVPMLPPVEPPPPVDPPPPEGGVGSWPGAYPPRQAGRASVATARSASLRFRFIDVLPFAFGIPLRL